MSGDLPNLTPGEAKNLCGNCAWRAECKKKYSFEQGGTTRCADFSQDVSLPQKDPNDS